MPQLSVLAVSPLGPWMLSAQIVFSENGTKLHCGRTLPEARSFLSQHPGALLICEGASTDPGTNDVLAYLLTAGRPSALILIVDAGTNCLSVEVRPLGKLDAALEILEDPALLRKLHLAWAFCKASQEALLPIGARTRRQQVMQ